MMTIFTHRPALNDRPARVVGALFRGWALLILGGAVQAGERGFDITEAAPGVYVHQGKHVGFEHADQDDIANIGFIVGERCAAVIDTGGSVAVGTALKQALRGVTSLPVCYVVNTHAHYDHLLGNAAFKEEGTAFVGHENLALEVERNRDFFQSEFTANLGGLPAAAAVIGPDITVGDRLDLDLGARTVTLTAHPVAHSYSDLSAYDGKTGTLWLSDLLFSERIPVLDGNLKGWLAVMEKLKTLPGVQRVVPGHGPVSLPWPQALAAQESYLRGLLTGVREKLSAGAFMEEVVETVGNEAKQDWLLHEQDHRRNVTRAFTELEWE